MGNSMASRIDIIGQNGNEGLHYQGVSLAYGSNQEREYIKKLISDHWSYVEGVLEPYLAPDDLAVIKFHYKTAMEHGWRHAKEFYTGNV